jgi:amino acid adenylation domain-containing protein
MRDRVLSSEITFAAAQYGKEKEYWLNKLSGELVKSSFPCDSRRTGKIGCENEDTGKWKIEIAACELTGELFFKLMGISKGKEQRLHIVLTAGMTLLLGIYSGSDDIILGTPIYRQDSEGEFINTVLALRNRVKGNTSFKEFLLQEVRPTVAEANENQNYPIETLLYQLDMPFFDSSREAEFEFPLFDAAILVENIHEKKYLQHTYPNILFSFLKADSSIRFRIEYNALLYHKNTIERITRHFTVLLGQVLDDPDMRLSHIDILSHEEKRQQLYDFNRTRSEYPSGKTINELFVEQVSRGPDRTALQCEGHAFTYRQLQEKAADLAAYLCARGVRVEEPVGIMAEHSIAMIVGVLGILEAGAAYMPLSPDYPEERKKYLLAEGNVKILLAAPADQVKVNKKEESIEIIDIFNGISSSTSTLTSTGKVSPANLAYIIYTSGSTGLPKGVMVEHRSVVRLVKNTNYIEFNDDDRIMQTGALEFDASTFEIWGALLNGLQLHLAKKENILFPEELKEALHREQVTIIWMTSALFNQMLDADIEIFSGLRHLLVGGDVLSPSHINRLKRKYPHIAVINGYGPTENTTFSLTHSIDKEYQDNIPIGRPIANSTACILGKNGRLLPLGAAGELCVGGDGVARGYLNNPELTAEKFVDGSFYRSYGSYRTYTSYKTGDLARWLPDGTVEFLGRWDQQVKIRGYRIEPGEVEKYILRIKDIKEVVVVVRINEDGEKYLCAYVVSDHDPDSMELRNILAKDLPDYMIPTYFVRLDSIPLTSNGKVDLRRLPEPEFKVGARYIGPSSVVQQKLVDIWSEVLGIESHRIGIDANFFELGGHSLNATILIARIHQRFNFKVPLAEIFRNPTIRELSVYIEENKKEDKFESLRTVEVRDYYELSSAQKRLYILAQLETGATVYNIPLVLELSGKLDRERLEESFRKLIARHESFRTSFSMVDEQPIQKIHGNVNFEIEYYDSAIEAPGSLPADFFRPFDLSQAPLIRVGLVKQDEIHHLLMIDMHHIITDGTSMKIVGREFTALYRGEDLPPLRLQYNDYSQWQNNLLSRGEFREQETFWLKQFEDEIPVLDLPTDYERPLEQSFAGSGAAFEINKQNIAALRELASKEGVTMFMMLLTLYNIFLSRLSGKEDIVIGTPVAGRRHADLQPIPGMFVSTLCLRNYPSGEKTFKAFLHDVKQGTLKTFDNQDYQFEELVEKIAVERDLRRNPVFDIAFSFHNEFEITDSPDMEIPGLKLTPYEYELDTSKFDLTLQVIESEDSLSFLFEYCTALFKRETVERFIGYFKELVSAVVKAPDIKISGIGIIPPEEKRRLLEVFNDTEASYPSVKTIHDLFEEQVERTPERIAVVGSWHDTSDMLAVGKKEEMHINYGVLNEKSDQMAHLLREKGVLADSIAAIMVHRSIEMVIGILGILKAGGAYLPIDLDYPEDRINYMLKDSKAKILLTSSAAQLKVKEESLEIIDIYKCFSSSPSTVEVLTSTCQVSRANLAYIIYTSGTTGKPKGTMIEHKNVSRLLFNDKFQFNFSDGDVWTMFHSYCFDFSVWEMYGALLYGGKLLIIPRMKAVDSASFLEVLAHEKVTVLNQTPSAFYNLMNEALSQPGKALHLKYVIFGGEALKPQKLKEWQARYPGTRLINMYGITETTVHVTYKEIGPEEIASGISNIGNSIPTLTMYIVDRNLKPVPTGVVGELLVGGKGVCRGYLNKVELTEEKFTMFQPETGMEPLRVYRSGDLGRRLPKGDIEFIGRTDHQVKIRGYRIEPEEVENQLLKHVEIKDAVVNIHEYGGDNYLCAYFVVKAKPSAVPRSTDYPAKLKEFLAGSLPGYMIPTYFVELERIPLTHSGKVDKKALPGPEIGALGPGSYAAPRNRVEEKLAEIWSEVLGIEKEAIGIDADFFRLGGHSLKATILVSKIHKTLQMKLPLATLFQGPTIRETAAYIGQSVKEEFIEITAVEEKEYYPLSSAQKRLYLLQQMDLDNVHYNMPQTVPLEKNIDMDRLAETLRELIHRHESLRTSFRVINNKIVQKVHDHVEFEMEPYLLQEEKMRETVMQQFIRPFDLSQAPLLRVGLLRTAEADKNILLVDMHHIISDGISQIILKRDFEALYADQELPWLRLRYRDFSQWQNSEEQVKKMQEEETYWLNRLGRDGDIQPLHMPTDYPRPEMLSFVGDALFFEIDETQTARLKAFISETGVTLNIFLLAVYKVLLFKYTGQEDILVGTVVAGRRHADLENIIGFFVNMLAIRNHPRTDVTFEAFLNKVKENAVEAYENQEYPFEELVSKLGIKRESGRHPLIDTVFVFQDTDTDADADTDADTGSELVERLAAGKDTKLLKEIYKVAHFDLMLHATAFPRSIFMVLEYATALFKPETIREMAKHYVDILVQVLEKRDLPLKAIAIRHDFITSKEGILSKKDIDFDF